MEYTYDDLLLLIAFIVCVECAKEPEYRCEKCDKSYKQEGRYKTHIAACGRDVSVSDVSDLLRQNREMMDLIRKQQETIQLLVSQLLPGAAAAAAAK
jgi:hypothetical protein